jgi:hypothetical protein
MLLHLPALSHRFLAQERVGSKAIQSGDPAETWPGKKLEPGRPEIILLLRALQQHADATVGC